MGGFLFVYPQHACVRRLYNSHFVNTIDLNLRFLALLRRKMNASSGSHAQNSFGL